MAFDPLNPIIKEYMVLEPQGDSGTPEFVALSIRNDGSQSPGRWL